MSLINADQHVNLWPSQADFVYQIHTLGLKWHAVTYRPTNCVCIGASILWRTFWAMVVCWWGQMNEWPDASQSVFCIAIVGSKVCCCTQCLVESAVVVMYNHLCTRKWSKLIYYVTWIFTIEASLFLATDYLVSVLRLVVSVLRPLSLGLGAPSLGLETRSLCLKILESRSWDS